ncbi:hypothetical protein [Ekhidna sp.]
MVKSIGQDMMYGREEAEMNQPKIANLPGKILTQKQSLPSS